MTLRDFLKANKSLTEFKKMYHELSKTKITYRQIEANLLTAGEDFIINALNISNTDCDYWIGLNAKWNAQLKSKTTSSNKTLGYWLKTNKLEKKFKDEFLRQYPKDKDRLNEKLAGTDKLAIYGAFVWCQTLEGFDFWYNQHVKWENFCENK